MYDRTGSQGVLKLPPYSGKWASDALVWEDWAQRLFRELRDAFRLERPLTAELEELRCGLEDWEGITRTGTTLKREKYRRQWEIAHRLLACAEQAAATPPDTRTSVDRACLTLGEVLAELRGHEAWALDCIRLLRNEDAARPPVRVSVAFSDELLQKTSTIATLVLDLLRPGGGQVFQHPADTLLTYPHASFLKSIEHAWAAAKKLGWEGGPEALPDGRWRLLRSDEQPFAAIKGRSASGAAARGWWLALQGKVPDEGVIVLTEIERDGLLKPVGGIEAKVKAIAEDRRFDTIVVASDDNQREAESTLRDLGKLGPIRVVKL